MCSAGAHGKMALEADSVDENLTAVLILSIMDHDETFKVSPFIINVMNLGEGRCTLKHLHVLHKHTHAEESPELIILRIRLHHRIDGQEAPFESGCFHIEMLLLIYSLFCKIQKMLRNLERSLL